MRQSACRISLSCDKNFNCRHILCHAFSITYSLARHESNEDMVIIPRVNALVKYTNLPVAILEAIQVHYYRPSDSQALAISHFVCRNDVSISLLTEVANLCYVFIPHTHAHVLNTRFLLPSNNSRVYTRGLRMCKFTGPFFSY